jgi:tripartite-type tricarboxylate transporter receptor subunit TctC
MPEQMRKDICREESMLRIIPLVICLVMAMPALAETADNYPNRTVRIIVPFAAGGPTDTYARVVAQKLQVSLGQPFIVENKPGASGIVGTGMVAAAPADGYTLLFGSNSSQVVSTLLQTRRSFDSLRDFRPLSMLLYYPLYLIVAEQVPAKTVDELVKLAKDTPGMLNFGSPGVGSGGHLVAEMFKGAANIEAVHVPYKGVGPAQAGLMGGEIQFIFDSVLGSQSLVDLGKLRGLAITGRERLPRVPDVPTLKESGYNGFEDVVIWLGMFAPAALPEPIAKKLEAELIKIAHLPDVTKRIQDTSSVVVGDTGEDFADFIRRETPLWEAIIKKNSLTVDN